MLKHVFDVIAVLCLGGGLMVAGSGDSDALPLAAALTQITVGAGITLLGFAVMFIRDWLWRY